MRIGYDAKRYFNNSSGLGNYSRDLIRSMHEYYPDNDYILYTTKSKPTIDASHLQIRTPRKSFLNKIFPSYWRSRGIIEYLQNDDIQVYHGLSGEIPIGIHKTEIRSVVTIHDLIFIRYPELYKPLDRLIYAKKFRYAAERADKVIAISEQTKRDIINFLNIEEHKIEVIYQSCHPAFKQPISEERKEEIKKRYQLPTNFILNVGSVERRKNALQIVKAIENQDIPLIIIGKKTPYMDEIKAYVATRALEKRVKFLKVDNMMDLAGIYQLASIFVYPSTFEGFGIPLIESLYSGTPVITNRSGVFPEAAGPSSWYIDPTNIDEISHAIQSILSSTTLEQQMRTNGLDYVQQFNDDNITCKIQKLYQNLANDQISLF
ncbi:glycosyltransferase family 4 protein [Sphingobacterium shayense]|uniref:glycosyltransferase family 4 protein n=1 Tax=Sphingobacterium shayense TaxID=626343 RepID=UPI001552EBDB|nr:glycosyltransferase family 1 protein [Sphingobacterium shayense]NQD72204.1 glycosyltransferase family 4 protein [Sphingobacterium shayense]